MTLSSKPKHTRHSSASHAVRQIYQLTLSFLATTSAISQAAAAELKVALPDVALQSASLPVFPPQALPFRSYKPHLHRDGDTNHRQAPFSNVPLRRRKADPPPAVTADAVPIASSSLVLEQAAVHRLDSADSNSTNANWSLEDPTESDPSWTFPRPFE